MQIKPALIALLFIPGASAQTQNQIDLASSQVKNILSATHLPMPTASTLGGIKSIASLPHNWVTYIDTSGVPHQGQPAATDVTGLATVATTGSYNDLTSQPTIPSATVPVPTPGTSITLTAPRGYAVCTGTCTVSLPVPAAGYEFCVLNDDNVATAITLNALGSGALYENTARTGYGAAGTGTFTATAAAGNKVCLVGRDATHYLTLSFTGTWTAN